MNPKSPARRGCMAVAFFTFILLPALADSPWRVDLGAFPLYVRSGWDPLAAGIAPSAGDAGWTVLPPAAGGSRNVRPADLDLPGVPKRKAFSFDSARDMDFSYVIPFEVPPATAAHFRGGAVPGLHFAALGDNWEIFLNGSLVKSEMHLGPDGRVLEHRANRDIHFPFENSLLRAGANVVAVHFVADPTYPPAGFHQASPYILDEYTEIETANLELLPVVLCGLYLFVGFYHLFMFLVRRQDRHNLFYGLFSIDLAVYLFVRTHSVNLLIADSHLLFRIELFSLFLILPLVGSFLESLHDNRVGRVTLGYWVFSGVLALVQLFTPVAFAHDVLRLWQFTALPMLLYYFGYDILWRFIDDGWRRWKRQKDQEDSRGPVRIYLGSLATTPMGNLLLGGLILLFTAVFDIVDAIYMQWDLVLTQYGFFIFTMGTALILANRLGFLHDRLSGLNRDLEERIRVLTETGAKLGASERRYRSLFEGTSDPVALLGEDLSFLESNAAAVQLFGLDRPGRKGYKLVDAVYAEEREGDLPQELLRQAVATQENKGEPREISLRIATALGESRPCRLRLERIDTHERREILLRVSPEGKDALFESFIEGRERFDIESSLQAADEVCRRASAGLARYLPETEAGFLSICLREVVVNAVEHGNLEVTFGEKSESQRTGKYFEFLQKRRLDPKYRSRRVAVEYSISSARATFRVTDEGPGFNHSAWSKPGVPDPGLLEHGRGIFLTRSAFDTVTWNEKGNQTTLVKWFKKA